MDYKDALADSLDSLRAGEERERVLAAHPEHADRLRDELQLADALRAHAQNLSTAEDAAAARARRRMSASLAEVRAGRTAATAPIARPTLRMPLLRGLAIAAVVLIAALGLVGVATDGVPSLGGATPAQAETLDGVVVETSEAALVLQTESGLESISLGPSASITDENGLKLEHASIEVGQVISVKAKRLKPGSLQAQQVQRKAIALEEWCKSHPVLCQQAAPKVQQSLQERCRLLPATCAPILAPTVEGKPAIGEKPRLQELANRCQEAGGDTCEELRRACRADPAACVAFTGWLRSYFELPEDVRERLRMLTQRCQSGVILDCRELRLLCDRTAGLCLPPAGERTAPVATPLQQVAPRQLAPKATPQPTRPAPPTSATPRGTSTQPQTQPSRPVR